MFVAIYVHFQRKIYGVKIKKTCWNKNPMKRRSKIREEIHTISFSKHEFRRISSRNTWTVICLLILIYRSKAGYKIYGVEILREEKSRMDPFKKTALSIPPSGGWIHRFHVSEDNDEKSVTSTSKCMHIPPYGILTVGKLMKSVVFFGA